MGPGGKAPTVGWAWAQPKREKAETGLSPRKKEP